MTERAKQTARLVGRGRSDQTPVYLHTGVFLAVAAVVGIVVGLIFLARWIA